MSLLYAEHGMHFFKPETHNLNSEKRTSGYAVGEFPVIYYIGGGLYKLFGGSLDFILRGINLLLFFLGLFYLFKLVYLVSKDYFWAIVLPMFVYTSPLVVYYANNFLPEAPSLGLVFIGWFYFFKMREHFSMKYLALSVLFFTLAALLKITSGISLVAVLAVWIFETAGIVKFNKNSKLFGQPFKSLLIILGGFVVVAAWYLFALHYNQIHQTAYFRTGIMGFWQIAPEEVDSIFSKFYRNWKFFIFNDSLYFLFAFALALIFYNFRKKFHLIVNLLLIAGSAGFLALWFGLLFDHDYYFVPLIVLPAMLLVSMAQIAGKSYLKIFKNHLVKTGFLILLIVNVFYAHGKVKSRYLSTEERHIKKEMFNIRPYLDSIGIKKNDRVICTRDGSLNQMLYFVNRQGWTDFNNRGGDSMVVVDHIKNGAKYLIVHKEIPDGYSILNKFKDEEIGRKDSVFFYRLKSYGQLLLENKNEAAK